MHIARGLYYSSYKSPRVLVWTIGVIIFIVMMATAFLGYEHSPKWFNISISYAIILIIVYYTIQNLVRKSKVLIYPPLSEAVPPCLSPSGARSCFGFAEGGLLLAPFGSKAARSCEAGGGNIMKNTKYNKLNNKSTYYLNKRSYSTIPSSNNSIEFYYSERLNC